MLRLGVLTARDKLLDRGCTLWRPFGQIPPEDVAVFEFQALMPEEVARVKLQARPPDDD